MPVQPIEEISATSQEFNALANLIGSSGAATKEESNFKLNLFPDQFAFSQNNKDAKDEPDDNSIQINLQS